jgi:hypothetical protein
VEVFTISGGVMTLTVGDDYAYNDGRSLEFNLDGSHLPDLTGATVALHLLSGQKQKCPIVVTGTVITATGLTRKVRFTPTAAQTGLLTRTVDGQFAVVITTSTRTITPTESRGVLTVLPRLT